MNLKQLYEDIWHHKLQDPDWLVKDGKGRVEYAVSILKPIGITENTPILDIGCGRGILGQTLNKQNNMFGIDISPLAIKEAEKSYTQACVCDLNEVPLPFPDSHFDIITMLDVIEHVLDPMHAIQEAYRCLKPGGWFILSSPNIIWWARLKHMILARRFPRTGDPTSVLDGGHLHYFTFRDLQEIIKQAGFQRCDNVGPKAGRVFSEFRGGTVWIRAAK